MEANNSEDLVDFINSFIKEKSRAEYLKVIKMGKRGGNIVSSMTQLTCLDSKLCTILPSGSKNDNLLFIKKFLNERNISGTCKIFSESKFTNGKTFLIDDALELALTSGGPVFILFAYNTIAFYESEYPGVRYLCVKSK